MVNTDQMALEALRNLTDKANVAAFPFTRGDATKADEAIAALEARIAQGVEPVKREYLQPADLGDLMRFQETTDDSEGYDISKTAIKRLVELGVMQSHGFGKYSITAFGHFALEHMFSQKPALPLMTNDDRDCAAITKPPGATT